MRTVSTHCKKMLCKISRSEVHGVRSVWQWDTDRHRLGNKMLCVFSIPRVFYRCPTTSVAPRLKNTCRPGRKIFQFQNHYRPCVDHNAVQATLDCVHRVTVLCAVLCTLSLISGLHGVFGLCCRPCPCCATLFYHAVLIYCCVLCAVLYAVYVYPPSRRWMVGNGG
jgi:hypothetical protein